MNQLQEIEIEVCRASGIETEKLFIKSRRRRYARPRQICMFIIRSMNIFNTLGQIGNHYGHRDHTSAGNSITVIHKKMYKKDKVLMGIIAKLPNNLKVYFETNISIKVIETLSLPIIKFPSVKNR